MPQMNHAVIEEAKHMCEIHCTARSAEFVFDTKAEELLFQKRTVSLKDSEKLVLDVDKAAE